MQTGDLLDRGTDGRKVLDLLMRLEGEARKAGGRVHALLGNHEVMNMLGDLRYVRGGVQELPEPESTRRREHSYEATGPRGEREGRGQPFDEDAFRESFMEQAPPGFIERTAALSAAGRYGRWLRGGPALAKVNGVVFVHGGLTPEVAALGCEVITPRCAARSTTTWTRRTGSASALAAGEKGPLWYRGLAKDDESIFAPEVDEVLQALGRAGDRDRPHRHRRRPDPGPLRGRVMIDAGMTAEYGAHLPRSRWGRTGALTAIYPDRREELVPAAAKAARAAPRLAPAGTSRILANAS